MSILKRLFLLCIASLVMMHCCAYRKSGDRQIVIAHRGASGYLPEHTNEAKVAAFMMGADYLEQDLVLTKDNVPIVLHDIHLDEVTNVAQVFPNRNRPDSRFYAIDFALDEIKKLRVTERFRRNQPSNPYFPLRFPLWKSDFSIPTFQEEIELIQGQLNDCSLNTKLSLKEIIIKRYGNILL